MQKQTIKGIIGAILVAVLFYFLSNYYFVRGGTSGVFSIIFVVIGILTGFTIGLGKTNLLSKEQRFFSFSWTKIAWTFLLGITAFFLVLILIDKLYPPLGLEWLGTLYTYFIAVYSWIFFLLNSLISIIFNYFIKTYNPNPFESELFFWGQMTFNLLWDYFLICLVFYIIRKFKK